MEILEDVENIEKDFKDKDFKDKDFKDKDFKDKDFKEIDEKDFEKDFDKCNICLKDSDEIEIEQDIIIKCKCCKFVSCFECISNWHNFNNNENCPQCKENFFYQDSTIPVYQDPKNQQRQQRQQTQRTQRTQRTQQTQNQGNQTEITYELFLLQRMYRDYLSIITERNQKYIVDNPGLEYLRALKTVLQTMAPEAINNDCTKIFNTASGKWTSISGKVGKDVLCENAQKIIYNNIGNKVFNKQTRRWVSVTGTIGRRYIISNS